MDEVRMYFRLNEGVPGYESFKRRVAFILTLIKGPEVAGWVRDMGTFLDGIDPVYDLPDVLEQFYIEFATQFQDSQKQQKARIQLKNHRMRFPEADQYISGFENLARQAGYTVGNPETVEYFIYGVSPSLLDDMV